MKPKNRKWAARAIKDASGETDMNEKFRVIKLLREVYGLHALTGEVLEIPRTKWYRYPDLFIPTVHPQIAILLHGDAPWHTEGSKSELSVMMDYDSIGVKLIIVWEALTNYEDKKILEVFDSAGLERLVVP